MDIRPGAGAGPVALGQSRAEVEAALGEPDTVRGARAFHTSGPSPVVVEYDDDGRVELVEVPVPAETEPAVTVDGIRLNGRSLDDVRVELRGLGHTERESDIGADYPDSGLAVWSMGARTMADVEPSADPDDDRAVVEGVSVAAPGYFGR